MRSGLKESRSDARESRPGGHRRGYRKENTSTSGGKRERARNLGRNIPDNFRSISSDALHAHPVVSNMSRPVVIVTGASRFDYLNLPGKYSQALFMQRYRIGGD